MDVEMPVCDGIQAATNIRAWENEHDHLPILIIALTAHDEAEYIARIYDAKMNDMIEKPLKRPQLLAALQKARDSKPTPIEDEPAPRDDGLSAEIIAALSDVKTKLWADLIGYVKRIHTFIDSGDAESIRQLGHTIKGFGGHLTHPIVTELGRAIQSAAIDRKFSDIKLCTAELLDYINKNESVVTSSFPASLPQPSPLNTPGGPQVAGSPITPGMQASLAELDNVVGALRTRFIQDLRTDMAKINLGLQTGDFETIRRTGHILKGVGGNLGHGQVADIGRAIMDAAVEKNVDHIVKLVGELSSYIRVVETQSDDQLVAGNSELAESLSKMNFAPAPSPMIGVERFRSAVKASTVRDLPSHLDGILVALDVADWEGIERLARSLEKGGVSIKDPKIVDFAKKLQAESQKQEFESVEKLVDQLQQHLEQVQL
eukprot:TRINITY_DN13906_c0_g1_i1.p1 TRINITY_DN13906_c0_g1~~TRINITY_DN13906_c0_g1_i1.p1  ORF type:complete len:502 (-),score=124.72 TRINITY_DN13906_c0_g1_i1:65-1357(-)